MGYNREKIITNRGCICDRCKVHGRVYDKTEYVDKRLTEIRGPREPGNPDGPKLAVHHIIPVKEGGTDHLDNLRVLCWPCHMKIHHERGDYTNNWRPIIVSAEIYKWLSSINPNMNKALHTIRDILED